MTPPGLDAYNITNPGYAGGVDWGSVSIDRDRGIMVVASLRVPNRIKLISREEARSRGIVPLTADSKNGNVGGDVAQEKTPYAALVGPFLSPLDVPCNQPPYGMISGIDLASRKLIWTERFGTARNSGPWGIHSMLPVTMGVPDFGGAITTRSGLTFIGASQDQYIRAFDTKTGKELWRADLPFGGQATPATYRSPSGRQYVVILAGGSLAIGSEPGGAIVAFALPAQ